MINVRHICLFYLLVFQVKSAFPKKIKSNVSDKPKIEAKETEKNQDCDDLRYRFRCDYHYIKEVDGWLKLHDFPANWEDARLRCQVEGAILASPLTAVLNTAMIKAAENQKTPIYTGIHATISKGDFYTIDGVPLSEIDNEWQTERPKNENDDEQCTVLLKDGTLDSVKCSATYPYLCYKNKTEDLFINQCGTADGNYTYYKETNHCYKFHSVPRTYSRAYMVCSAEGGHLAIINSKEEAELIKNIFAEHPESSLVGPFWKEIAFVGITSYNLAEPGEWRTIHGQSLEEAGYDVFAVGEPNNSTTGEYCGSVYRNGKYNDVWCNNVAPFICEKKPTYCPNNMSRKEKKK